MFFLIGFVIFLFGFVFVGQMLGGRITDLIDFTSLLMILIPLLGVLTATRSFRSFYGGMKAVILPKEPLTEELRGQAASLFRLLSKTTALASGMGVLVSLMNILMSLDFSHPEIRYIIGNNVAASLIVMLYGLFLIAAVFEPVVFNLKKRRDTERK